MFTRMRVFQVFLKFAPRTLTHHVFACQFFHRASTDQRGGSYLRKEEEKDRRRHRRAPDLGVEGKMAQFKGEIQQS